MISHISRAQFLPDAAFKSEAQGIRELLQSLAGRARVAYELAAGTNPYAATEPPASPYNPDHGLGHNHSGPPFGSAFRHPIATISRKKASAGNIQMPASWQAAPKIDNTFAGFTIGPWVIWNRAFSRLPGGSGMIPPYSRAYLRFIAHRLSSTPPTLTIAMRTLYADGSLIGNSEHTDSIVITSTSETGYTSSAYVDLYPGRNIVVIALSTTAAAANGIVVDSLSLNQIAKRSH